MGVVIGTKANGGWSTVDPKPDSSFTGWANQFGRGYNGDGTRFLFFSESGNDANAGTPGAPLRSYWLVDPFYHVSRSGFPDRWLFKKGDIFTHTSDGGDTTSLAFGPTNTALYGSPANLATFFPMVITCYDPANLNPPIFNPQGGGALPILEWDGVNSATSYTGNNGGRGKNLAIGGINFFASRNNPRAAGFTGQYYGASVLVFNSIEQGGGFVLIEDCGARNAGVGIDANQSYSYFRRNRIRYCASACIHSQGETQQDLLIEENLLTGGGWYTPVPVTANTSNDTFTLTNGPPDSGIWANNTRVKLFSTFGNQLPQPLENGQSYWLINVSGTGAGGTFKLSLTVGGAAIDISLGSGGTYYLAASQNTFNHNLYGGYGAAGSTGLINVLGNHISSDQEGGSFMRGGGQLINNALSDSPQMWGLGSARIGQTTKVQYNVLDKAGAGISGYASNYQFGNQTVSDFEFSYNVYAHGVGWGVAPAQQFEASAEGLSSHNIIYDWGSYATGLNFFGFLKTFNIINGGSGGDGRVLNFARDYPPGSGGVQSLDTLVGGSGGTPGTYQDILFTGGSGTNVRGDVDVGAGGNVTAVRLTQAGDLFGVSGDTLTASGGGLPSSWSFKLRPYTIEMRPASGSGTGCQVKAVVTFDGQIHPPMFGLNSTPTDYSGVGFWLSRTCTIPSDPAGPLGLYPGAVCAENRGNGGLKLVAGGTQYSTGQVLTPFGTPTGGPSGGALPSGFQIKVGPYAQVTRIDAQTDGLQLGNGSISGHHDAGDGVGGLISLDFQTVGGVTTASGAHPFVFKGESGLGCTPGHCGNYVVGDRCTVPTVAGLSGVVVECATVTALIDDGTNSYNGVLKSWMVTPPTGGTTRNRGTYMTFLGNPGGFPSTDQGFFDAVEQIQTRATWNDLLMAESYDDYIRQGMGAPMLGSAYAALASGGIFLGGLGPGTVGTPYTGSAAASGGSPPYTYTYSGTLPLGLGLTTSTGDVTGTPTVAGVYTFRITATDFLSVTGFRDYNVTIAAAALRVMAAVPGILSVTGRPAVLTYSSAVATPMTVHLRYRKKG